MAVLVFASVVLAPSPVLAQKVDSVRVRVARADGRSMGYSKIRPLEIIDEWAVPKFSSSLHESNLPISQL